ncbi:hypothetical protein [Mucilaginibacter lacusdianchii]|uniref:hypothetical protein n=1 Tax=Mucilaginibacter lacusdianchii TaxID=2684211 RepID=UPI00131AA55A|nr:hypothetical protein [Mucilaginibacter sp. JXJ CY 39]
MKSKVLSILYIFLISGALLSCKSRAHDVWAEGWESYPIPETRDEVAEYAASNKALQVYLKHDSVLVRAQPKVNKQPLPFEINIANNDDAWQFGGDRAVTAVNNGYLVGFNRGEWGGHLYWFSKDGKQHYKISDHQVVQFIQNGGNLYAIEGLVHGGSSEGSMIIINQEKDKWRAQTFVKLPYAPVAAAVNRHQNFIIATSSSLVQVNQQAKVRTLAVNRLLRYMPPANSLVIKGDEVYVGMVKGVFRYDLQAGKQEWLMNDGLQLN